MARASDWPGGDYQSNGARITSAELCIELESRDAYSAVALGRDHDGLLASQECYRSPTRPPRLPAPRRDA
jgi:hypothetical protein